MHKSYYVIGSEMFTTLLVSYYIIDFYQIKNGNVLLLADITLTVVITLLAVNCPKFPSGLIKYPSIYLSTESMSQVIWI